MLKKILALVCCSFMLFSCQGSNQNKSGGKSFTLNVTEEGKTLDPQLITSSPSINISSFLVEGLTRIDKNKEIVLGLAKSYTESEDGLVYTFKLREGLKWSNGDPLTAKDFRYAWLRALDPNVASEYAYMLFPIKNAEEYNASKVSADEVGIKVLDDLTLEVTLNSPTPYFLSLTAFITYAPANEDFITKQGDSYALEAENYLSSGPFVIEKWVHNSEMHLVKNENYYDKDNVKLDDVNIKFISDPTAALNAFKNEEIDVCSITAEQYMEYKDDARLHVVPQATVWYLLYNTTKDSVFQNAKIRTAFLQAVDKESMAASVFNNVNKAVYSLTPKGVGMHGFKTDDLPTEIGELVPKYDPARAKELLSEGMKELGLTTFPEVSIILNDGGLNKKVGEAIQEDIRKNLGVDIKVEAMAFKERVSRMHANNFDIVLAGWGADYQDPLTFLDLLVSNGGNNNGRYKNPEYDKYVKIAQTSSDPQVRFEAFKKLEGIIAKETPLGMLYQQTKNYLVNEKLSDYGFRSIGGEYTFRDADVK